MEDAPAETDVEVLPHALELVVGRGVETGICQYCRSLVSFHCEIVDRAVLSLKDAGVPSFLIE
jgi:hypothetical protein